MDNHKGKRISLLSFVFFLLVAPSVTMAQGAAPEMFGVREVVIDNVKFDDPKAADMCGLTRQQIADDIANALAGTGVPAVPVAEARPPVMGVARINLIPTISARADDSLNCTSWVGMSAENRANAVIPPVGSLRSVTVIYWRQHTTALSNQSTHHQVIDDVVKKMTAQFAQQYKLDQPPDISK